jgi:hypothetical protein
MSALNSMIGSEIRRFSNEAQDYEEVFPADRQDLPYGHYNVIAVRLSMPLLAFRRLEPACAMIIVERNKGQIMRVQVGNSISLLLMFALIAASEALSTEGATWLRSS